MYLDCNLIHYRQIYITNAQAKCFGHKKKQIENIKLKSCLISLIDLDYEKLRSSAMVDNSKFSRLFSFVP